MVTVGLAVCPVTDTTSCDIAMEEEVEEQLSPDVKEAVGNGVHSSYLLGKGPK